MTEHHHISDELAVEFPTPTAPEDSGGLDIERLAWAIRSLYGGTPPTAHQQAKAIAEAYAALAPSQEVAR